jgi:tellurium resistance protein TerD
VSTWWSLAPRADLGAHIEASWSRPFSISNKGWHLLRKFLFNSGAASTIHLMAGPGDSFVPTRTIVQWGRCIESTAVGDWYLVEQFNGRTVVPSGLINARDVSSVDERCELTPLQGTGVYLWLLGIGQELSTAPSGYLITSKPKKGSPMSISTVKGQKVDLGKAAADAGSSGLDKITIGLGWDTRKGAAAGTEFDLDAVVIGCDANGKAVSEDWRIFFNRKTSPAGAITHHGDNLTGEGDGDDEQVSVVLSALPAEVVDLRIYVTIYEAKDRGNLNFGLVENAFVRLVDEATETEVLRFDLSEDAGPVQSIEFAKIYRQADGSWAFKALANGQTYELDGVFAAH